MTNTQSQQSTTTEQDTMSLGAYLAQPQDERDDLSWGGDTDDDDEADSEADEGVCIDRFIGDKEDPSRRVKQCMEEAVTHFTQNRGKLQDWWLEDNYGFDAGVIENAEIGWIGDGNNLVTHLRETGFDDAVIAMTGLATSNALKHVYRCDNDCLTHRDCPESLDKLNTKRNFGRVDASKIDPVSVVEEAVEQDWHKLYAWWSNRIVFPYRDSDGDVTYTIGRRTESTDDRGGKYLKQTVKNWHSEAVREPIYGVNSYDGDGDVILTEGVTDAIWAFESGFDCLSPVTKQFKSKHNDRLLELVSDADTVYLCNDAEDTDQGLEAALDTADFLDQNGIDVRVAELPRDDDEAKVDLADYLADNSAEALRSEVLDVAVNPSHERYEDITPDDSEYVVDSDEKTVTDVDIDGEDWDGDGSALFNLTIKQVIRMDPDNDVKLGYRGDNPIQHVGDSHSDYFVYKRTRDGAIAYDHKADHGYTALTWLACVGGVRSPDNPGGLFSDREILETWTYAKEKEYVPEDDPTPYRCLIYVAEEMMPSLPDEIDRDSGLSQKQYDAAVLWMKDEMDVNPGREFIDDTNEPCTSAKAAVVQARHLLDDDDESNSGAEDVAAALIASRDD